MSRRCDFPVFDADNHMYETKESFTRHLPDRFKGAIDYVELHGRTKIMIRGTVSDYIPNPTFEVVAQPGAQEEYFRNGNPEGKSYRELIGKPMRALPGFSEPAPRLELMDELGVDRALMFPTLASLLEERMRDEPELTHAAIHALNEWMYEQWTFNYEGRIFATPVITLPIVEKAIEELEWVVARGAKTVLIRPAPVPGHRGSRSFGFPEFDPFWQAVVDADILVSMHASDSGYSRYQGDWTGPNEYLPFKLDAFRMMSIGKRPMEDTMTALTCHGVFSRFPDLRVASIESGGDWVAPFVEHLADIHRKMPQAFDGDPVEQFKTNVYISPFHEDNLDRLIATVGPDHVLFGSDYPHPEGLAEPCSYLEHLPAGLADEDVQKIMGGNLSHIMRVDASVGASS
ncbi:MAG TPA: amidohydrolase family protein [Acidimicrobiales bacterium]|jgi:predicted TIM-barrel fold metal-dependent hydrolase|nr:amidohydrolase family protein [Acidimicrobiales bacterium]